MHALVAGEVKRTLSLVPGLFGVLGEVFGSAAPEPHQADSKDGADLAEVERELGVRNQCGHDWPRIVPPRRREQKQSLVEAR
jgi:hypothetical protein